MQHIKLLFWLKWKLTVRSYRKSMSAVVGALLMLLLLLPISIFIGFGATMGFLHAGPFGAEHLSRVVLAAIYIFWLMAPVLGYALNDSYDITKLFIYPLTVRQIFTGVVLGSLLDVPTLLLLPTLTSIVIGFTISPGTLVVSLLAVGFFLFHTLSLTQAILLYSAGVLRSRRFRDISVIVFFVIMILYYVTTTVLLPRAGSVDWRSVLRSPLWEAFNLLPPGVASRAVVAAAQQGAYGAAFGWLLLLAGYTVGAVYLASWLLKKVYEGDSVGIQSGQTKEAPMASALPTEQDALRSGERRSPLDRLPPVISAIVEKEIRYFYRDPAFRLLMMNMIYIVVVMVIAGGRNMKGGGLISLSFMMGMLMLFEMQLLCNVFGSDGAAVTLLFLFPCSRTQILLGKNLIHFTVFSLLNSLVLLVVGSIMGILPQVGMVFFTSELGLFVLMAVGNFLSIYFPLRIVMQGWRIRYRSGTSGFGFLLLYLLMLLITVLVLTPVILALLLPTLLENEIWYALTVPLSILYSVGLYALSLRQGALLLERKEVDIIEKLTKSD